LPGKELGDSIASRMREEGGLAKWL
jgi:hypothetical protein